MLSRLVTVVFRLLPFDALVSPRCSSADSLALGFWKLDPVGAAFVASAACNLCIYVAPEWSWRTVVSILLILDRLSERVKIVRF